MMKSTALLFAACMAAALHTSCLVQETVTRNGEVEEEGYVFKRPIKEAIENTKNEDRR